MGRRRKSSQSDEESKKENRMDKATSLKNAATANARERARMQVLSKAFVKLKTTLPWVPPDTKLSKLDTLRLATSYIAHLRQILAEDDEAASEMQDASDCASGSGASGGNGSLLSARQQPSGGGADSAGSGGSAAASPTHVTSPTAAAVHPINFTWPYSFHGRVTTTATPEVIEVKPQLPCSATS